MNLHDLEQEIMCCWQVVDDLKALMAVYDRRPVTEDEIQNALLGLETLYQMKFEKLFDVYADLLANSKTKHQSIQSNVASG